MYTTKLLVGLALVASLAGCFNTPGGRAIGGAVAGAAIADITNNDVATGAAIGAIGGAATCGINLGLPAC